MKSGYRGGSETRPYVYLTLFGIVGQILVVKGDA